MFADYHVHSHFSEDTDFPMELEIQKAIKLGMFSRGGTGSCHFRPVVLKFLFVRGFWSRTSNLREFAKV